MRRRVAWIGVALLAIYLVFIGGGWLGIYRSELRVITVAAAGGVLVAWAVAAWRDPAYRPSSALLPALVVALASLGLSTIVSRSTRVSLEYLAYAVVLVALYLLLVTLLRIPFFRDRIVALGGLLFVALALEFVVGVGLLWLRWWGIDGTVSRPPLRPYFIGLSYGNPSAVLTMVALLAVPAAARASFGRWRIPALGSIVVTIAVVALLSGSRAGWLGLAVAAAVALVVGMASAPGRVLTSRVRRRIADVPVPIVLGAIGAALVVVVGAAVIFLPAVLERVGAGGEELRAGFLTTALRLFGDSPVLGTGPGTWAIQRITVTAPGEIDYFVPHAHDVPVQVLAELGVVGALAGAFLLASVGRLAWLGLRSGDAGRRWWAFLTVVALAYFAVHNLIDFYANFPAVLFAVALPIAYLDAAAEPGPLRIFGWQAGRLVTSGALVVCLALAGGLLAQEGPASLNQSAVAAAERGDWDEARNLASAAAEQDPGIHVYLFTAGLAAAHTGDLESAARDFRSVAEGDDLAEAWLNLAAVERQLGDSAAALDALDRSLRLGRQRPEVAMAAGNLALELGATDRAIDAFSAALGGATSLIADPWWQADPSRSRAWTSAMERAVAAASSQNRWQLALMAGRVDEATGLAEQASRPVLAAEIVAAWGGDPPSAADLLRRCRANPLDLEQLLWCARIAERTGDVATAQQFRALAEGISPGSSASGSELRVATEPGTGVALPQRAAYWGIYTYRRPTPADMLLPSLIHLVLV